MRVARVKIVEAAAMAISTVSVQKGLGVRPSDLSVLQIVDISKWVVIVKPFIAVASALGRISFALYLKALFSKVLKWQAYSLWIIVIFQIITTIFIIVADLTQCGTHLRAQWDLQYEETEHIHCVLFGATAAYIQGGEYYDTQ